MKHTINIEFDDTDYSLNMKMNLHNVSVLDMALVMNKVLKDMDEAFNNRLVLTMTELIQDEIEEI